MLITAFKWHIMILATKLDTRTAATNLSEPREMAAAVPPPVDLHHVLQNHEGLMNKSLQTVR